MAKTFQFKNEAEATNVMGPLFTAGKIAGWNVRNVFGKTFVRYQIAGRWFDLRDRDLAVLVG